MAPGRDSRDNADGEIRGYAPPCSSSRAVPHLRVGKLLSQYAPEGRALPESWADPVADAPPAMDRACEGGATRQLVSGLGMTPVVPPKANRKAGRDYDRETCKFRKKIERLFWRFNGCRRLFTRFDKLDATFPGFASLAAVFEMTHDLA